MLFLKKLGQCYEDISKKRKSNQTIRLQTDQGFQQNDIKRLYASNNITMFSTREKKAEKLLLQNKKKRTKKNLRSKRIEKGSANRLKLNKLIKRQQII